MVAGAEIRFTALRPFIIIVLAITRVAMTSPFEENIVQAIFDLQTRLNAAEAAAQQARDDHVRL